MMDCNKEDAMKAIDLAEKKMEKKDFEGAKKMAMKAQQLYPDLLNISQMIMVCEVHCASQSKRYGNEIDWYGVLQIEPTADEVVIKKQYRKLALSLHPDKNKFAGATDAFKMIGEAQKVLLDREKRLVYDNKCKVAGRYQASHVHSRHGSRQTNARGHPWFQSKFAGGTVFQEVNPQHQQQQRTQPGGVNGNLTTFWTVCPFCSVKYQYYRNVIQRNLRCQNCQKDFTAYELNPPGEKPPTNSYQPVFPKNTVAMKKGSSSKTVRDKNVSTKTEDRNSSAKRSMPKGVEESTGGRDSKRSSSKRKKSKESSESSSFESSSDSDEDVDINKRANFGVNSDQNLRRSARSKQQVSYDEIPSDDDDVSKRSKNGESFSAGVDGNVQNTGNKGAGVTSGPEKKKNEMAREKVSSADEISRNGDERTDKTSADMFASESEEDISEVKDFEYPDPDFSDFEKGRKEDCFAVGQLWAVYDTMGAMPRFYAIIRKVLSRSFKLRITWFEPHPDEKEQKLWVGEGLPASCGKFILGNSEVTDQLPMFSHLVLEKINMSRSYEIFPKRGETWALFKGWNINWHSDPKKKNPDEYEYEFTEILSDYDKESGATVTYLGKLKGFACLFCRIMKDGIGSFLIPATDLYRFSHKVPSFQMTGEERLDVPRGSFELDPASLPRNIEEIDVLSAFAMDLGQMNANGNEKCTNNSSDHAPSAHFMDLKAGPRQTVRPTTLEEPSSCRNEDVVDVEQMKESQGPSSLGKATKRDFPNAFCNGSESSMKETEDATIPPSEAYETPEPEFYNFDADKSKEKFQVGQVWAVYGDEDALPKSYGIITKIDSSPNFALYLMWLMSIPSAKHVTHWIDKQMPVCCGDFMVKKGSQTMFADIETFSHQLRVCQISAKQVYGIYPEKGDVWALYKNWHSGMTCSDLDNCEYEIVEILDKNDAEITVLALELVNGYKTVFKPKLEGRSTGRRRIPFAGLFRFSHQIPAFRLCEEKNGSLKGFWELDTAAVPIHFFRPI